MTPPKNYLFLPIHSTPLASPSRPGPCQGCTGSLPGRCIHGKTIIALWTCVEIQWGNTLFNSFLAIFLLQERTCPTVREIISSLITVPWWHFMSGRSQHTVTWQQVVGLWQWLERTYDCFKPKFQHEYYENTKSLENGYDLLICLNWNRLMIEM